MLIDAHCHLSGLSEDELKDVLTQASANGVQKLVAIGAGYGFDDNLKTLDIAKKHESIFCALGMHPHDAKEVTDENFTQLKTLIQANPDKVKAVGEIGLDYHYMHSDEQTQKETLRKFAQLSHEVKRPIVIHDRDCGLDCANILKEENIAANHAVIHCFTGTMELAKTYLDMGFYISFTGIITFKKADDLREVVKMVPLDRMMVETDSPFLAPVPFRGKKNQPAYVKLVAEAIAELKNESFENVCKVTSKNTSEFFDLN